MTDAWGDGWQEVFAFKQNGVEVATFGQEFDHLNQNGYYEMSITLFIPQGVETQLVVKSIGYWP